MKIATFKIAPPIKFGDFAYFAIVNLLHLYKGLSILPF